MSTVFNLEFSLYLNSPISVVGAANCKNTTKLADYAVIYTFLVLCD